MILTQLQIVGFSAFLAGVVVGLSVGAWYFSRHKDGLNGFQRSSISLVIFLIWATSSAMDIYNGTNNTSVWLQLFMGATIGTMNHEAGEWIAKVAGSVFGNKIKKNDK